MKALVHLAALGDAQPDYGGLAALLLLAQALLEDLEAAAAAGGAAVLGATRLGGAFGVGEDLPGGAAPQGAVPGFLKTLAQEWPDVRVKSVDLDPGGVPGAGGRAAARRAGAADGLVEVGYREGERTQSDARAPRRSPTARRRTLLDGDSVVLVTGGARGITAQVALALAERHRPTLVLVGRTAAEQERPETAALAELAELRHALIDARKRGGQALTPALVEQECRGSCAGARCARTSSACAETGARVEYLVCDVADGPPSPA